MTEIVARLDALEENDALAVALYMLGLEFTPTNTEEHQS
jgi:hypothetical protein